MGFFSSKKKIAPLEESRKTKCDHLGYPKGQPQQQPLREHQNWNPPNNSAPQSTPFQPAGYLPPPPAWNGGPPSTAHQSSQDQFHYGPPIIVNQHYYLSPPPPPPPPPYNHQAAQQHGTSPYSHSFGTHALSRLKLGSVVDLAHEIVPAPLVHALVDDGLPRWHCQASQLLNQGAALYDQISSRFNDVVTLIDRGEIAGHERELFSFQPAPVSPPPVPAPSAPERERGTTDRTVARRKKSGGKKGHAPKGQTTAVASSLLSGSYFAKVELYANSRLPMDLPPLKLYIPTWPLVCLAAQYSERVYEKPRGAERDAHVNADWRTGTKAMCIKSVPMDHMHTIVFAIRGTATFMDWAVNLNTAPTAPTGFLDDATNFCHAGFLSAARKMIQPVAARLRQLLEENPHRSSYSLLITGHSAGGAIASLLYSHMLSTSKDAASELNLLTGCFKRIHCITFGTPPVSLFPLAKPNRMAVRKYLFLSFINEGDPVVRADKAYVKSLLELFAAPAPGQRDGGRERESNDRLLLPPPNQPTKDKKSRDKKSSSNLASKASKSSMALSTGNTPKPTKSSKPSAAVTAAGAASAPVWRVPPSTLSNAGRLVVLRSGSTKTARGRNRTVEERLNEGVVAQITNDEQLRGVIWGDPVCHVMRLYAGRIETLAVGAVTVRGH